VENRIVGRRYAAKASLRPCMIRRANAWNC